MFAHACGCVGLEQVALAVAVYIASFVATLYAHPNDSERIDVLETVQHISILVMLIGGYILRSGLLTTEETETISHGLVVRNLVKLPCDCVL